MIFAKQIVNGLKSDLISCGGEILGTEVTMKSREQIPLLMTDYIYPV